MLVSLAQEAEDEINYQPDSISSNNDSKAGDIRESKGDKDNKCDAENTLFMK